MLTSSLAPKVVVYAKEFALNLPLPTEKPPVTATFRYVGMIRVGVDADVLRAKNLCARLDRAETRFPEMRNEFTTLVLTRYVLPRVSEFAMIVRTDAVRRQTLSGANWYGSAMLMRVSMYRAKRVCLSLI